MLMLVETSLEDGGQEKSDAVKTKRTCVHHGATIMMMNEQVPSFKPFRDWLMLTENSKYNNGCCFHGQTVLDS